MATKKRSSKATPAPKQAPRRVKKKAARKPTKRAPKRGSGTGDRDARGSKEDEPKRTRSK